MRRTPAVVEHRERRSSSATRSDLPAQSLDGPAALAQACAGPRRGPSPGGEPMSSPSSVDQLLDVVKQSGLLTPQRLDAFLERRRGDSSLPDEPNALARAMISDGLLTKYQVEQILLGRFRNFIIGNKYRVLERI